MKKAQSHFLSGITAIMIGVSIGFTSCQEEVTEHSAAEIQALTKSSVTTGHEIFVSVQEVLDITSDVLSDEGISIEGTNGSPENCPPTLNRQYIMDLTHYDTIIYAGTITLAYGTNAQCTDINTNRRGIIQDIFTYVINEKNKISTSVSQTISFRNFKRNNIQFDGTIKSVAVTGSADTLKIGAATITYENGRSIQWHGILANQRINAAGVIGDSEVTTRGIGDTRLITGTIASATPDGKHFTANIRNAIRYSYECSDSNALVPVQGTVEIQMNQFNVVVDYGDGKCDRSYTVTINGNTVTYTF
jgi:hypothetical protein